MPPAAKLPAASQVEVAVDFDSSIQSLSALDASAYRLIGTATCQIDRAGDRYLCRLVSSTNPQKGAVLSSDELKERFLNLVADENLRIRVAEKTEGIRRLPDSSGNMKIAGDFPPRVVREVHRKIVAQGGPDQKLT